MFPRTHTHIYDEVQQGVVTIIIIVFDSRQSERKQQNITEFSCVSYI